MFQLHEEAAAQIGELEEMLFTSEIDKHILDVFDDFKSLRR